MYNIQFHTYGYQSVHLNLLYVLGRRRGSSKLRLGVLLTGSNYEAFITALKHGLVDLVICDSEENVDVSVLLIEQDLEWVFSSLISLFYVYFTSLLWKAVKVLTYVALTYYVRFTTLFWHGLLVLEWVLNSLSQQLNCSLICFSASLENCSSLRNVTYITYYHFKVKMSFFYK